MPGFPDKFMPFMEEPPGAGFSSTTVLAYGKMISSLREITNHTANKEPRWRHRGTRLTTGYEPGRESRRRPS
jgi:hydrogenase small subunit